MVRGFFNMIFMSAIAFVAALLLYPLTHELGHALAALLLGGKPFAIELLPLPCIVCEASGLSNTGLIIVGLSGLILPALIALPLRRCSFFLWYTSFIMRGIVLLSMAVSAVTAFLYCADIPLPEDDITGVLELWRGGELWLIPSFLIVMALLIAQLASEKPMRKIIQALSMHNTGISTQNKRANQI
jgi:hypothetical protein